MVDLINSTRKGHIITIEDPIEFVHSYKKCVVTQREIGMHSPSFATALRNALREDPDVILVGEMRDLETISLALTAAETGIQVLASLHTNGAARSIDRIVNVFPARRQEQVRNMLAEGLQLVVSQQLVVNCEGTGRVVAAEVLINNNASASMIRGGKAHQLGSVIQSGSKMGMQSLDSQLKEMVRAGDGHPRRSLPTRGREVAVRNGYGWRLARRRCGRGRRESSADAGETEPIPIPAYAPDAADLMATFSSTASSWATLSSASTTHPSHS